MWNFKTARYDPDPIKPEVPVPESIAQQSGAVPPRKIHPGVALWADLHQSHPDPAWFAAWLASVAQLPGCGCRKNFAQILSRIPPDYSSIKAWRLRTWEWHNAVNQEIAKPAFTLEEATARWGW